MHLETTQRGRMPMLQRCLVADSILQLFDDGGRLLSVDEIRERNLSVQMLGVALYDAGGFQDMRDVADVLRGLCPTAHMLACTAWSSRPAGS